MTPGDYCIGPGDVLVIDVFGWQEMSNRHVRVSPRGTITLPFLGKVPATGQTESALRSELERRLRAGYVREPHVRAFVERFTSQQVSVTGAVPRPGLYALSREQRTLYDLLVQAGGLTEQAGGRVVFSPATMRECNRASMGTGASGPNSAAPPLAFDLDAEVGPRGINPLGMPMIGGDSIVVTRGRFLVQGWVDRPGLYSFSPGMTAFDAATIAGGALFPADLGSVHVLRARPDGTKKVLSIDLNDVRHGDAHDITLHEGDVVKFDASL